MLSPSLSVSSESAGQGPPGPRILFFSGGSALRESSRELARSTRTTVHLVTPFDSGGSSASLRKAFSMPAVGDARSRVMALAEPGREGNPEIFTLFSYRLPKDDSPKALLGELIRLVRGSHPLLRQVPEPAKTIIREHLGWFALHMPADFPLAGASVGNLILTGGYLHKGRRLGPTLALFSRLVRAKGLVRPIVEDSLHLAVRLASGKVLVGQHQFTGKDGPAIDSPIADIWLVGAEDSLVPVTPSLSSGIARLIRSAACICYPVGSFYSSLVANLLPRGVGRAVAACPGSKIFIPNLGEDPELLGCSLACQIEALLRPLLADAPGARPSELLSLVLVDREKGQYPGGLPEKLLRSLGIALAHFPLVQPERSPLAQPGALAKAIQTACAAGRP